MRGSTVLLAFVVSGCVAASGGATPTAVPVPPDEYVFFPYTDIHVEFNRGEFLYIGKLDAAGNFEQELKYPKGTPRSSRYVTRFIGNPSLNPMKAYEFRSGMLTKGELTTEGNFVPEAGSKVIRFTDYKYSPDALPIWNLPGYFKKVEKPTPGKDSKDKKQ